jgi:hypothetical protein
MDTSPSYEPVNYCADSFGCDPVPRLGVLGVFCVACSAEFSTLSAKGSYEARLKEVGLLWTLRSGDPRPPHRQEEASRLLFPVSPLPVSLGEVIGIWSPLPITN